MDVYEYLKTRNYVTASPEFYTLVDRWRSWYQGNVTKFHEYKVYNGVRHVKCRRKSLGMAKKLCEDWANLLMNERVKITIRDEKTHDFVHRVFAENNFWVKINESQEVKSAVGTVAYLPYADQVEIADGSVVSGKSIRITYVPAENIFPLSWKNGEIQECAFSSLHTVEGKNYLFLQIHALESDGYGIENVLFSLQGDQLQEVSDFSTVKGFESVVKKIRTLSHEKQFVIDRLNIANNLDPNNPMGVSVYANAMDLLEGLDLIYDSYINEFMLGKKRIMVRDEAIQYMGDEPVFDDNDVVFYRIPPDMSDDSFIKEIDMNLRITEHQTGIRDLLNTLAAKCGFGEHHYKFDQGNVMTATQVISENSTLFRVLKKHEIILEDVLKSLVRILVQIGIQVLKQPLMIPESDEITIDFDDSIIEDQRTEFNDMRQDVAAGLLRPELYVAKRYGVSEEEAKNLMPKAADLLEE